MEYFAFSILNYMNFAVFAAPGCNQTYNDEMKKIKNMTSFSKLYDKDVCVWPFAGGTPSGDATGTTLLNTDFSDTYEVGYTC